MINRITITCMLQKYFMSKNFYPFLDTSTILLIMFIDHDLITW